MTARSLSLAPFWPFVLLFGLLAMTARNPVDPDLYWHLRTGQLIVESGHVPRSDPFSFTRAGQPWVSHEWLSEVAFYELWQHGGEAALIVFSAAVTSLGFLLLYLRCSGARHWAAAATALGALAAAPCWGVRPQMFTFTLASLLLWLLDRGASRPKLLWFIPPIVLLWLNLHAGFALGPALLVSYTAGLLLEAATGDAPWQKLRPVILRHMLILAASLALVPLNPAGLHLFRYPFDTLRSIGMRSFIVEWFSPDFHQSLYRPLSVLFLLLLTAFAITRRRPQWRSLLPLLLGAFAALDAVRHIPIFVLVAIPVLAAAFPSASVAATAQFKRPLPPGQPWLGAALVLFMASFAIMRWRELIRDQTAREAERFPLHAIAFLQSRPQPQRLFVYYDWGGYAIWRLYPKSRVFVDGRADLYGDQILAQFKITALLHNGWREVLDHWRVEDVLLPPASALAQALLLDATWHTAFRDSRSILLVRNRPSSPASLAPRGEGENLD